MTLVCMSLGERENPLQIDFLLLVEWDFAIGNRPGLRSRMG